MTRLSVIIPVYNVEAYLDECLASLEAQGFRNFEAVCVDDGSTDGSGEVLHDWEARVPWLRVVTQANGGVSAARNAGLDAMRGDYACFLDGDDRLVPSALGRMAAALDDDPVDVLTYGGHAVPECAAAPWIEAALRSRDARSEGFDPVFVFAEGERAFPHICVSHGLVDAGLRFDERMAMGEDLLFRFAALGRVRAARAIPDDLYEYRVTREGSATEAIEGDLLRRLDAHLAVMGALLFDYESLGLLGGCLPQALAWSARYVAIDALTLPAGQREGVLHAYADALLSLRERDAWLGASSSWDERRSLGRILTRRPMGDAAASLARAGLVRASYGRLAALRSLAGRG